VRTAPDGLSERRLLDSLFAGWGLAATGTEYMPVGGGSHHWRVVDDAQKRYFVTVDDLDQKGYLGADRDSAFDGLRSALETAGALRHQAALEFVVAPMPSADAMAVRRIDERYAVAVYPVIEGTVPGWGAALQPGERAELVQMLARLHQVDPAVAPFARTAAVALPARPKLEAALRELSFEWAGGPFSEPARALLADHATHIGRLLLKFDELVHKVDAARAGRVITHGEPHGGNLIRAGDRLMLIDWDTVGLAPRERDLWMLATANPDDLDQYAEASGRSVNREAIALYRLRWQLDDISLFVDDLRSPHERTEDTEHAWSALLKSMPV
jgi:spectinomycin phosphotransferase